MEAIDVIANHIKDQLDILLGKMRFGVSVAFNYKNKNLSAWAQKAVESVVVPNSAVDIHIWDISEPSLKMIVGVSLGYDSEYRIFKLPFGVIAGGSLFNDNCIEEILEKIVSIITCGEE